jgi:uncharacterized membrane protein (DUF4010 family)
MFARVLVEVGVLNFDLFRIVWIPIVAAGLVGLAYCGVLFLSQRTTKSEDIELANPFGLSVAIKFGLLYAVILLISRFAQLNLGETGLYISSFISGIADVDAITLSVAELTKSGGLDLNTGSRAIVIAAMSNTIVKGCIAIIGGSSTLRKALLPGIILIVIVGVSVAFII